MRLIELQRRFHGAISAPGDPDDGSWPAPQRPGLTVYRNAYRARLIECLRATYPKCLDRAGEDAFDAAASHHVILNPPHSWTLDAIGGGFDGTLAELFRDNPELSELAWLEWTMGCTFTASDRPRLDAAAFTAVTAGYGEDDWTGLTLAIAPELKLRLAAFDMPSIWRVGAGGQATSNALLLPVPAQVAVWRDNLEAQFRLLDDGEAEALLLAKNGMTFGQICALLDDDENCEATAERCGMWLGRWIADGLVESVRTRQ